jgi:hypothetical protein
MADEPAAPSQPAADPPKITAKGKDFSTAILEKKARLSARLG